MAKINPVQKQVEEMEDKQSDNQSRKEKVDEMLAVWEEVKDNTEQTKSKSEVTDRLPSFSFWDGSKLWRRNPEDAMSSKASLTDRRKDILLTYAQGPELSQTVEKVDACETYVRSTVNDFKFLLDDPVLFEAFVLDNRTSVESWSVSTSSGNAVVGDEDTAFEMAREQYLEHGEVVDVVSPDGEVFDIFNTTQDEWSVQEEPDLSFDEDRTITEDSQQESMSSAESNDDDGHVSINPDELTRVMAALYRDNQDDLADELIERAYGGK